tara:strand:- start:1026 stop:1214 length:189 start_codon:yes stop_codon:yes gene_type:complete
MLLLGIVEQINGDIAVVEYKEHGKIKHSQVLLSQSACTPVEGQSVYFFKDYKIVTCENGGEE